MSRAEIKRLVVLTLAALFLLAVTGGFIRQIVPDTPTYFDLGSFPANLAGMRAPLYGWLVDGLGLRYRDFGLLPAAQTAIYLIAVWLFLAELRWFGLSGTAVLSVGIALLFSNSLLLYGRYVHPEIVATACGLFALAGVVRFARLRSDWVAALLVFFGSGLAYLLRPTFLPFIGVLPLCYAALRALQGSRPFTAWTLSITLLAAIPFVGFSGIRAVAVGDFGIASFGGYEMSGMAGLLLSDETVSRLPPDLQPLGASILAARRAAENSGQIIGVPLNSGNVRSFDSAALSYFDVLARTYDQVIGLVGAQRKPGETWVEFNRRLTRFSFAVVRASPVHYAAWVFGASERLMGHAMLANLVFMVAAILLGGGWIVRVLARRPVPLRPVQSVDLPVLAGIAAIWLAGAGALSILLTFPAIRYIDTANLLLAAVPIYVAMLMFAGRQAQG